MRACTKHIHAASKFSSICVALVQLVYQRVPGVLTTAVGYTAGQTLNPTYKEVCSGKTYHAEAVQLTYDPAVC